MPFAAGVNTASPQAAVAVTLAEARAELGGTGSRSTVIAVGHKEPVCIPRSPHMYSA